MASSERTAARRPTRSCFTCAKSPTAAACSMRRAQSRRLAEASWSAATLILFDLALQRGAVGAAGGGFDALQTFGRDLQEQAQHVVHHGRIVLASGDRSGRARAGVAAVAGWRSPEVELAFDGGDQMRRLDRFRDIRVHAGLQAALAIAVHGVGRHGDDRQIRSQRGSPANQAGGFEAVEHGHLDVHQHQIVVGSRIQFRQRLPAVVGDIDVISLLAQNRQHHFLIHQIVFHQQQARGCRLGRRLAALSFCTGCAIRSRRPAPARTGSVTQNVLPLPNWLSTRMSPPCISTRRRVMASPSPVPPYFRVMLPSAWVNFSKIDVSLSAGMPGPVSTHLDGGVDAVVHPGR